jgi:hypothetical protein
MEKVKMEMAGGSRRDAGMGRPVSADIALARDGVAVVEANSTSNSLSTYHGQNL